LILRISTARSMGVEADFGRITRSGRRGISTVSGVICLKSSNALVNASSNLRPLGIILGTGILIKYIHESILAGNNIELFVRNNFFIDRRQLAAHWMRVM